MPKSISDKNHRGVVLQGTLCRISMRSIVMLETLSTWTMGCSVCACVFECVYVCVCDETDPPPPTEHHSCSDNFTLLSLCHGIQDRFSFSDYWWPRSPLAFSNVSIQQYWLGFFHHHWQSSSSSSSFVFGKTNEAKKEETKKEKNSFWKIENAICVPFVLFDFRVGFRIRSLASFHQHRMPLLSQSMTILMPVWFECEWLSDDYLREAPKRSALNDAICHPLNLHRRRLNDNPHWCESNINCLINRYFRWIIVSKSLRQIDQSSLDGSWITSPRNY